MQITVIPGRLSSQIRREYEAQVKKPFVAPHLDYFGQKSMTRALKKISH